MAHRLIVSRAILASAVLLVSFSLPMVALTAPPIASESRTVFIGAEGTLVGKISVVNMGPGKMGWIRSWTNGDSVTWKTTVERSGEYQIASIIESSGSGCGLNVVLDERTLHADCGDKGWKRVEFGTLHLVAGQHAFTLSSVGDTPLAKFFSLEFVRPKVALHLVDEGRKQMVDTSWMVAAGYGLMFHWTSQTVPREGPPQSYCDAVRNFDVVRF